MREEVLRAVLKADLIGFHTYDYARHFVSACTRILGLEVKNARSSSMPNVSLLFDTQELTFMSQSKSTKPSRACYPCKVNNTLC